MLYIFFHNKSSYLPYFKQRPGPCGQWMRLLDRAIVRSRPVRDLWVATAPLLLQKRRKGNYPWAVEGKRAIAMGIAGNLTAEQLDFFNANGIDFRFLKNLFCRFQIRSRFRRKVILRSDISCRLFGRRIVFRLRGDQGDERPDGGVVERVWRLLLVHFLYEEPGIRTPTSWSRVFYSRRWSMKEQKKGFVLFIFFPSFVNLAATYGCLLLRERREDLLLFWRFVFDFPSFFTDGLFVVKKNLRSMLFSVFGTAWLSLSGLLGLSGGIKT